MSAEAKVFFSAARTRYQVQLTFYFFLQLLPQHGQHGQMGLNTQKTSKGRSPSSFFDRARLAIILFFFPSFFHILIRARGHTTHTIIRRRRRRFRKVERANENRNEIILGECPRDKEEGVKLVLYTKNLTFLVFT